MNRWSKNRVEHLQREQIVRIKLGIATAIVKVALKKTPQSIGKSRGGWTTKIHNARTAITFSLSPGQAPPEGVSC